MKKTWSRYSAPGAVSSIMALGGEGLVPKSRGFWTGGPVARSSMLSVIINPGVCRSSACQ